MGILRDIFGAYFSGDTGEFGESLTALELKYTELFGRKGVMLRNLYLPKENGETSEIDLLYITQKGIFVIESKNYSGWIFGNGSDQYWTQMLPNKQRNRFYNPIRQNRTHIKWLLDYLGEDIKTYSMIVFSERCELKKVDFDGKDIWLCKRDELFGSVRYVWNHTENCISDEKVQEIAAKLEPLTHTDDAVKQMHIDDINRKYDKTPDAEEPSQSAAETAEQEADMVCPRCGAALILRTAKKGANAGNQFYGCTAFPKCRYIRNINDHTAK